MRILRPNTNFTLPTLEYHTLKAKRFLPLAVAVLVYLSVAIYYALRLWSITEGKNLYVIDDAYIHMAIAKNFALHGVYGITRYYFSNASSSPLWTFLISGGFKLVGLKIWVPFVLALLSGVGALLALAHIYDREKIPTGRSAVFLLALLFLTSFWGLTFTGLEHLLQILTMALTVWSAALILSGRKERGLYYLLYGSSSVAAVVRPESWALIAGVFMLFLISRRWKEAFSYAIVSFLPVVLLGLWSKANGNGFLPNTYYLKGTKGGGLMDLFYYTPKLTHLSAQSALIAAFVYLTFAVWKEETLRRILGLAILGFSLILLLGLARNLPVFLDAGVFIDRYYLKGVPSLIFSLSILVAKLGLLLTLLSLYNGNVKWEKGVVLSFLLAVVLLAHFHRGGFGWFFRYEAYLIALTLAFYPLLSRGFPNVRRAFITLGWIVLLIPLLLRGLTVLKDITPAVRITHLKNYHLAVFVSRHFNGKGIAMDDIGYVSFLSDAKVVDFVGLGTYEVAKAIHEGRFNTDFMRYLVKKYGIEAAILRPGWYVKYGGLPGEWLVVGTWKVEDVYYPGSNFLTFMAVDREMADDLQTYLEESKGYVPPEVDVQVYPPTPLEQIMSR